MLTLSRPEHLNTFTVEMADELVHAFGRATRDDAVRCIVVAGAGRAFCAGMDLAVRRDNVFGLDESLQPTMQDLERRLDDPKIARGVRDTGGRVALAIYACDKPTIAAVQGVAVGIGSTMLLPMDIRICSEDARFGFVFGKLGIVPEACSTWFLPRVVGLAKALRWTYTGEYISSTEALNAGLVEEVLPGDRLLPRAMELASLISEQRSAASMALIRHMMYRNSALPHPLDAHKRESLAVFYTSREDGKEGVAAFLQKRPPHFTAAASSVRSLLGPWD